MTGENEECMIDKGPLKFDLMLSLFDTEKRMVQFYADDGREFTVQVTSVERHNRVATRWTIVGVVETPGDNKEESVQEVSIYYRSDIGKGRMVFLLRPLNDLTCETGTALSPPVKAA